MSAPEDHFDRDKMPSHYGLEGPEGDESIAKMTLAAAVLSLEGFFRRQRDTVSALRRRLRDAELSLARFDEGRSSEYWERYGKEDDAVGASTASPNDNSPPTSEEQAGADKLSAGQIEEDAKRMADEYWTAWNEQLRKK